MIKRRQQLTIFECMLAITGAAVALCTARTAGIAALLIVGFAMIAWARTKRAFAAGQDSGPRAAGLIGVAILTIGWLWARLPIWYWQSKLGYRSIGTSPEGAVYEFWGLTVPGAATGIGLASYTAVVVLLSALNRRVDLVIASLGLGCTLGFLYFVGFVCLDFEAFN